MKTRLLESKEVLRACVGRAAVEGQGRTWLLLKTEAVLGMHKPISSADSQMATMAQMAKEGKLLEGRLRLDLLADEVVRVRYAPGTEIPENDTPMVIGQFKGPRGGTFKRHADRVEVTTAALRIKIGLTRFRIEVQRRDGTPIVGIGGPEKDHFCQWDAYNTGVCHGLADGAPLAVECFDLHSQEAVYGLGEKFIKLNKVGQTIDLDMADALGVTTPRSYKNIPFFVSTHGYGVFFNHSSPMTFWVGSRSAADLQAAAEDGFLDYYVFTGSIREVLERYTTLTGKGALPPKWTFGYWQSKISYKSAEETLDIARQLRANEVPCDVIHLDTHWFKADWFCDLQFDRERFPDPAAYLGELARMGFKVSLWQLPYIPEGSALFDELKAVDGFVKNKDGGIYNVRICFTPGFKGIVGCVDYTHPAAVKVHQDWFRKLFRLGAKVVKTDFGEAAPADGVYHDGTPGHRMHNLYPLLYNKAIFEVTREETGDGVVWARSAWAGNQRYPLHWGGDNSPNYANMIPQVEGGLSFGLSGFQFWSQDIGGFCGTTSDELLIRWMQMGMFLSHSRIHGFGDRELYKFKPETMRICREYIRLRYRLMPYLYGTARACIEQSVPMARALVVDFQEDPNVWNMGDEWLLGDSLLVAPIVDETGQRAVYLPQGVWTDWWTGRRMVGPRWLAVRADLETMPLFVREGALLPMGPAMNYVDEKPTTTVELRVAPFAGSGRTCFAVPVGDQWIPVEYVARNGRHTVKVARSAVKFRLKVLGKEKVALKS